MLLATGVFLSLLSGSFAQEAKKEDTTSPVDLGEIVISAPKLSKSLLESPLSATVTTGKTIQDADMTTVKDAAFYAPNTFFTEFSARKLSNPRFRGVGGSPMNPGVTTYMDGVPQFNGNSSSITLLDVAQIDFVRGPQAALFGRNTAGGLINITSNRPSLDAWHGSLQTTLGNYNSYDYRGSITGPLIQDQLGFSFAGGYNERDGYTRNTTNGSDLDSRSSYFGKTQFLWTPNDDLEVRLIIAGESASDGDYALNDLGQLRANPRRSARDFVGYTQRDVLMPTLQIIYHADLFDFTSTTGLVWWETEDATDLDYSTAQFNFPLSPSFLTRTNHEQQTTWTQEFRFANPKDKPVILNESAKLAWQAGAFFFHQDYDQRIAQRNAGIFGLRSVYDEATTAGLRDAGFGLFLQSTLTLWDKLDITGGLRWDYEDKAAQLATTEVVTPGGLFFDRPAIVTNQRISKSFSQVTPQAAVSWRITPDLMTYFSFAGGFKAGGFNSSAPAGSEAFGQEHSWNYELGLKGRALDNRLSFGAALFYTDWKDLQLNVPNVTSPGRFNIANAGDASARGIELDVNYRPVTGWDLFASAGWIDTRFHSGSTDNDSSVLPAGANTPIAGNQIPYAPDYTASVGTQFTIELGGGFSAYARGDVQFIGSFNYDSLNRQAQDAYTIANFRVGVRNESWFLEGFANNAFNTKYVPIAFAFPDGGLGFTPSGYVGESGAPITFGVRSGIKF